MRIIIFFFMFFCSVLVSGCCSIMGMVTEKSIDGTKKKDIIMFIGTQYCLECIFSEWGWSSAGHPGPFCVSDLPFSLVLDTASLAYTVPKSVWNLCNEHDPEIDQKEEEPNQLPN